MGHRPRRRAIATTAARSRSRGWRISRGGASETWYIDANNFLEIARVSTTADFGQDVEKRSYFSDFRDEGGLVIPHRGDMEYGTRNEILVVENVRPNVPASDDLFPMPPPEGMDALQTLSGEWNLRIETRAHPRAPWVAKEAPSSITRSPDAGLLEERFTHVDQGLSVEVVRTWSYDRFRKVHRITHADNFAFHQNVLEGTPAVGRLTATNEKSGTIGGATWTTDVKYTYTREQRVDRGRWQRQRREFLLPVACSRSHQRRQVRLPVRQIPVRLYRHNRPGHRVAILETRAIQIPHRLSGATR